MDTHTQTHKHKQTNTHAHAHAHTHTHTHKRQQHTQPHRAAQGGDRKKFSSRPAVGGRLLGGFPQLGSQPTERMDHATSAQKKASRGEGRVGAGQECRPGDQGMMGGRRTQSSDCYGRALVRFFTCRAGARPCYSNGPKFCAARLHVFASP